MYAQSNHVSVSWASSWQQRTCMHGALLNEQSQIRCRPVAGTLSWMMPARSKHLEP